MSNRLNWKKVSIFFTASFLFDSLKEPVACELGYFDSTVCKMMIQNSLQKTQTLNHFQKIILILIFLVLSVNGYSTVEINSYLGVNIFENAGLQLDRTLIAPELSLDLKIQLSRQNFFLNQKIGFTFYCWNHYIKNYHYYSTEKTLSFHLPLRYYVYIEIPKNKKAAFLGGGGTGLFLHYDRDSLGKSFWYSYFYLNPIVFLSIGVLLKFNRKFQISLFNSSGSLPGLLYYFSNQEYITSYTDIFVHNQLSLEFHLAFKKYFKVVYGWFNQFNFFYVLNYTQLRFHFNNNFYLGVIYEF
ncbi:MAG: hypothetical protein MJB14_11365 [Spirochaetes bacterium]|nr:hypothetical protein [Spirochaetota bacterium]